MLFMKHLGTRERNLSCDCVVLAGLDYRVKTSETPASGVCWGNRRVSSLGS